MEFGTAGMRGIMGAGLNRINLHTVRRATQGYADYLKEVAAAEKFCGIIRVAIAYDNRKDSDLFAFETACVLAANNIEAHLFNTLSATPLLSYAVRKLDCRGGVVITASHNSKDYNGYKIYDENGCQCLDAAAARVAELIEGVDIWGGVFTVAGSYEGDLPTRMIEAAEKNDLIRLISTKLEEEFVTEILGSCSLGNEGMDKLNVVYTPLNGTGMVPVREILTRAGVGELDYPEAQMKPDPEFPTCPEPNPEKADALKLGLELCRKKTAEGNPPDILLATDPDCDRVGVAVYDLSASDYKQITGNQVGVLLLDYIIERKKGKGTMPCDPIMVTTIVSTPLAIALAEANGVEAVKVLTGFKYIGNLINGLEKNCAEGRFIFGFEESCGYLSGTHARDKDAVNASLLICEMAALYKTQGKTLLTRLDEIGAKYGYYKEALAEYVRPGERGMAEIASMMAAARSENMRANLELPLKEYKDYAEDAERNANVVEFDFEDGSRTILRPSGTEPKLKVYFAGIGKTPEEAEGSVERLKSSIKF
jgi:phosphoglucomutase